MPDPSTPAGPSVPRDETARRARWVREVRSRLSSLRLSPAREAEIIDELAQHLDDHWRELIAGGAEPDEATRLTLAQFRSSDMLAQQMAPLRQARAAAPVTPAAPTGHRITDAWLDLRYAARVFSKQPGFAAAAVLTLALGIGASTAIFSVVYGVLLKPLPFPEPETLVSLYHRAPGAGLASMNQGPRTYLTYRDNQRSFEDIGAWDRIQVSITGRGEPEQVEALSVTDATLPLLKVPPLLGRLFDAQDDAPGNPLKVILTYGYWQRRFGGAPDVVGQPLRIDDRPATVIAVLPSSFMFPFTEAAVLLPMQLDRADPGGGFGFQAFARLNPGVTLAQANADMARMIALLPAVPYGPLRLQPNVLPLTESGTRGVERILWILLAAVSVVLLIACANVANLFLVRAEGRQQEFSMRAALGASRSRIARALLSESLLLALAAGIIGLALAQAGLSVLRRLSPADLPRTNEIGIDPVVLLFTLTISLITAVLFGLVPVMRFGLPNVTALREGGRAASDGPGRHRTRNALVIAQVALALVLMIVSGLMIRTSVAMRQVSPGFMSPKEVQTFVLTVPERAIEDPQQVARTHQAIAERLAQVPGVTSVGLSSSITMDGEDNSNFLLTEDFPTAQGQLPPMRRFKSIAPGYFETMGNRLVAGRAITWTDIYERRPVAVISETLAREYWHEPSRALGRSVRNSAERPWREIVGVVGDERDDGLNHPATAIVYWPMLNDSYRRDGRAMAYAVRSKRVGGPGFQRELEQAVWSVNPNLPLAAVQTLDEIRAVSMAQTSFAMVMLVIAASVALVLGVVGIYGVITYVAAQRTREVGIRIALGAQIEDVRRIFLRHGLRLAASGTAVGIVVALALTRVMSALLFGVGPMDPLTYAGVSAVLGSVAILATYLPARRAARVDPVVALRAET